MSSTLAKQTSANQFPQSELIDYGSGGDAMVVATTGREVAEIQSAMVIAKRFPRDQRLSYDRIMTACQRPGLAETATYQYARGGTDITGPSIRLAETLAREWGNMQYGVRELDQRDGVSTVEAFAIDLEANLRAVRVFQVKHVRHTKTKDYAVSDPRDIYEMVANAGARRVRACILSIIPGDITEAAVAQCDATLKAKADVSPEAMKKMVTALQEFEVTKEQIEARIQRKIEAITPAQVISLRKIYVSLKDGMSSPEDWFSEVKPETIDQKSKAKEIAAAKYLEEQAAAAAAREARLKEETEQNN